MGFKQHISRTWQMIEQQVNDVPFRPHHETAKITGKPRRSTRRGLLQVEKNDESENADYQKQDSQSLPL